MSVCDKRCEACQYADCINDEMGLEDYREADARDRALGTVRKAKDPPPVGGDAAKKEAARERAREKVLDLARILSEMHVQPKYKQDGLWSAGAFDAWRWALAEQILALQADEQKP